MANNATHDTPNNTRRQHIPVAHTDSQGRRIPAAPNIITPVSTRRQQTLQDLWINTTTMDESSVTL